MVPPPLARLLLPLSLLASACGEGAPSPARELATGACPSSYAGCTSFTVASGETISFGAAVGFEYAPRCLRASPGHELRFEGDFGFHPLEQGCGPTAIPATASGSELSLTLSAPGLYGYYCSSHGTRSGQGMAGAILIAP